ncbi:hypothetical protein A2U01_0087456, partial [Trifolium medium]|nr:hypothetical protein [Trifolium medium]
MGVKVLHQCFFIGSRGPKRNFSPGYGVNSWNCCSIIFLGSINDHRGFSRLPMLDLFALLDVLPGVAFLN